MLLTDLVLITIFCILFFFLNYNSEVKFGPMVGNTHPYLKIRVSTHWSENARFSLFIELKERFRPSSIKKKESIQL